jgi:hypothetical protein
MHTQIPDKSRWLRCALAVAIAFVLLAAAGVGPAHAGVAHVQQCAGAGDELLDASVSTGGFISFAGCGGGGEASLLSSGGAAAHAPVALRNLTFSAPGSTTFVGGRLYRQMHGYLWWPGEGAESWAYGYVLSDAKGTTLESCGFTGAVSMGDCFTNTSFYTVFSSDHFELPAYDSHSFTLTVGCGKVGACHHWYANPGVDSIAADLLVRDDVAPVATGLTGPLATADPVHAGDTGLTLGATDTSGLGVYDVRLLVDDAVVKTEVFDDNGGRCVDVDPTAAAAWRSGQPCPTAAAARAFSFDQLPEGNHNVKVQIRDAALNETLALNRDVTVDLIPSPTLSVAPAISGTPRVGHSLAATPGTWDDHGHATTFSYRWLRCDANGAACGDTGSSNAVYELAAADAYHRMVVEVSAQSDQGTTTGRSAQTEVVHDAEDRATPPAGTGTTHTPPSGGAQSGGGGSQASSGDARGAANGTNATDNAHLTAAFGNHQKTLHTKYGARPVIRGRLTGSAGKPIGNARIELLSKLTMSGAKTVDKGGARTRSDGSWTLILPKDVSSRTLTLRYRSHVKDKKPASQVVLHLAVRAGLTLKITPRSTHNHGTIRFGGKILGHSIPAKGKVVELQARGKGHNHWITFKTLRVHKGGALHAKYTFHSSSAVSYQFRARARAESGYPFLTGVSRLVGVRVR